MHEMTEEQPTVTYSEEGIVQIFHPNFANWGVIELDHRPSVEVSFQTL